MTDPRLSDLLSAIEPARRGRDGRRPEQRQAQLTKPAGSLGVLEDASVRLCGIQRTCPPAALTAPGRGGLRRRPRRARAGRDAVAAGGHRVDDRELPRRRSGGQRAGPPGRCRRCTSSTWASRPTWRPDADLFDHKVRRGTSDLATGPAMTRDEAVARRCSPAPRSPTGSSTTGTTACSPVTWASPTPRRRPPWSPRSPGSAPRTGHRTRHRRRRPDAGPQGRGRLRGAARPAGHATTRSRRWRRSAASSTPASPGFVLGARPRGGCRSSSTA